MKKIFYFVPILLFASCFFKHKSEIPAFNILLKDSVTLFNTQNIPEGKTSILLFFSPDCIHCQKETVGLLKKMDSLKDVNFYFITIEPMDRLRYFDSGYKLSRFPNITVGQDYTVFLPGHFKDISVPYTIIYDRDKALRAVFKGETTASAIIETINKID